MTDIAKTTGLPELPQGYYYRITDKYRDGTTYELYIYKEAAPQGEPQNVERVITYPWYKFKKSETVIDKIMPPRESPTIITHVSIELQHEDGTMAAIDDDMIIKAALLAKKDFDAIENNKSYLGTYPPKSL